MVIIREVFFKMTCIKKILSIIVFVINGLCCLLAQDFLEFEVRFAEYQKKLENKIVYNKQVLSEFEVERELESIFDQLYEIGFFEVVKDSCQYDSSKVKCFIRPKEQYRYYVEPGNIGEEILAKLSTDKYFSKSGITPFEYNKLTNKILGFFQNKGYPFANISLGDPKIRGDSIQGKLKIDRSNYIVFDTLEVDGDININSRFLAMHTGIKPDENYSEDVFENLEKKLSVLDFISVTRQPRVLFTNDRAKVNVGIEQRASNRFDGIAGAVYDEGADNPMRLTGQVNLYLTNTFERGEWMDLRWQGLGYGTQSLDISAGYPYLFYTPVLAEMQLMMRKQDSTYLHIQRKPAMGYRFKNNIRAKVFVDWRTSELLDAKRYKNAEKLPGSIDYRTILYGVGASYKSDLFNIEPRKGFNYSIQIAMGNRNIEKNNNIPDQLYDDIELESNQYMGQILLQRLFPFGNRSALAMKGEGGMIIGEGLFENELFRVGGVHSLRGFEEESIIASSYAYLLAEYRYVIGQNSYLSLFANSGYVERKTSDKYRYFPFGAGTGISQELPAGILSLFFAFGNRQDQTFNLNDIKVHVGFMNTF